MDRSNRLKKSSDFQRVRKTGKAQAHPFFVLIYAPNSSSQTHIGVVASRSLGNAVKRNRAKRRLRASIQLYLSNLTPGFDIILIARKPLLNAQFELLSKSLENALRAHHLVMDKYDACHSNTSNA